MHKQSQNWSGVQNPLKGWKWFQNEIDKEMVALDDKIMNAMLTMKECTVLYVLYSAMLQN